MNFRSCQEVSRLTLAAEDRRLSLWERFGVTVHRMICAPCRYYRRQIESMARASKRLGEVQQHSELGLESDAKARIRERLRQANTTNE